MALATPSTFRGARISHCSDRFPGSYQSSETLPVQSVGAWISSREPRAVSTWLSPLVCGTVTSLIEPPRACRKICSTPHGPAACRYSPLVSRQASRSPRSPVRGLRGGVSPFGCAPLTGTSQSCGAALPGGAQDARIVPLFHQRTGLQVFVLVLGTGSCLISEPWLLISLRPWLAPVTNSAPDGAYSTAPSAE